MKKHHHTSQCLGTIPFLALWTIGHALIWPFVNIFLENDLFYDMPELLQVLFIFCVIGTLSALLQAVLMRSVFRLRVRNWVPLTALGWLAGAAIAQWYTGFPGGSVEPQIPFAIAYAVPALLQAWLLRHKLRGSWLWAGSGIISALLFLLPIDQMNYDAIFLALFLGSAGWGILSGSTLVWLIRNSGTTSSESFVLSRKEKPMQAEGSALARVYAALEREQESPLSSALPILEIQEKAPKQQRHN